MSALTVKLPAAVTSPSGPVSVTLPVAFNATAPVCPAPAPAAPSVSIACSTVSVPAPPLTVTLTFPVLVVIPETGPTVPTVSASALT